MEERAKEDLARRAEREYDLNQKVLRDVGTGKSINEAMIYKRAREAWAEANRRKKTERLLDEDKKKLENRIKMARLRAKRNK